MCARPQTPTTARQAHRLGAKGGRKPGNTPARFLLPKPPPHSCVIRNSDSSCQGGPRGEHRGLLWCGGHQLKHPIIERKTRAAWSPAQRPTAAAMCAQPPRPYSRPACSLTACTWVPLSPASQAPRRPGPDTSGCCPVTKAHPELAADPPWGTLAITAAEVPQAAGASGMGQPLSRGTRGRGQSRASPTVWGAHSTWFTPPRTPHGGTRHLSVCRTSVGCGEQQALGRAGPAPGSPSPAPWPRVQAPPGLGLGLAPAPPTRTAPAIPVALPVALRGPPQCTDQPCQTSAPRRPGAAHPSPRPGPFSQQWGYSWQLWGSTGRSPQGSQS